MAFYKHYSFDLWLTLIKSNPTYKQERVQYFFRNFNGKNKSIDEIAIIFRQVDLMVNAINEKVGKNVDAEEMYLMIISMINDYDFNFSDVDLKMLDQDMEQIVFNHMPKLYCDDCLGVLAKIKESGKSSTNILSNTGFIKGKTLKKVIEHLGIGQFIDFQLYSDEVRLSKPNTGFFQLMLDRIDRTKHPELLLTDVIHVGDNPHADVRGAEAMGINSMLINSNNLSISNLLYDTV
ncbi:putative hydrolase of the HAD superfamily [Pedobacter sp. AK013]|uniref:HAD family hydrolase n=1 Tax=Pedobacter sp. AK013 TaxID=2723071 RepID=UPI00161D7A71|nr:HAD family hydrolase [Pedobacter sp. AK013]MBB6239041.1 putative hydrolase of the HAD superfamily [Pedobacter sp. AK013]